MLYVMRVLPNATVVHTQKIANGQGGLPAGSLASGDSFGSALTGGLGDVDGDGLNDIAVAAVLSDLGITNGGALYIFFMAANDTVRNHTVLVPGVGGAFGG